LGGGILPGDFSLISQTSAFPFGAFEDYGAGEGCEDEFGGFFPPDPAGMAGIFPGWGAQDGGFREVIAGEARDAGFLCAAEEVSGIGGSDFAVEVDDGDGGFAPDGGVVAGEEVHGGYRLSFLGNLRFAGFFDSENAFV